MEHRPALADRPTAQAMRNWHWVALILLALAEIVGSLFLASLNPVVGYDENWYLINSYRLRGLTDFTYAAHRPPMLPVLLALAGGLAKFVPALAHIASSGLVFLLLRRVTSPLFAFGGALVFMACGEVRLYGIVMLTEMPAVFFLLLVAYLFVAARPALAGAAAAMAIMTHWSQATAVPAVLIIYLMRRRWREGVWFLAGLIAGSAPFLIASVVVYGHPLAPFVDNLAMQRTGTNKWWWYLNHLSLIPWPLCIGLVAAIVVMLTRRIRFTDVRIVDLCALLVGIVLFRMVLLHCVIPKGLRFVLPLFPLLIVLSMLLLWHIHRRAKWCCTIAWLVLLVAVLPGRRHYYQVHDLLNSPVNQLVELKSHIKLLDPTETLYSDLNDMAVRGHTRHRTVAVTGGKSRHIPLEHRAACSRDEIPDGAPYLTYAPAGRRILAASTPGRSGTLSLVRWTRDPVDGTISVAGSTDSVLDGS